MEMHYIKMIIENDELKVFYLNEEEKEGMIVIDLKNYYLIKNKDLEGNVFSAEDDWLFGEDLDGEEEFEDDKKSLNCEFMENFCCDVPADVLEKLNKNNILVPSNNKDDFSAEDYLIDEFNNAIKAALNLDEEWNKKA